MFVFVVLISCCISSCLGNWNRIHGGGGAVYNTKPNALLSGRRNAAMWVKENDIYVLGGRSDTQRVNDFWKYEIKANRWFWQPDVPSSLFVRSGSSQWIINGLFWLYGGRNDSKTSYSLDDMWSHNPSTREWKRYTMTSNPGARFGSSFWTDEENNSLYLFGGKNDTTVLGDVWRFNVVSSSWELVSTKGLSPRDDAISVRIGDEVYLFGDNAFTSLNLKTMTATNVASKGDEPKKRADSVMWTNGDVLYLLGGRSDSKTFGDFWSYDTTSNQWFKRNDTIISEARWGSAFASNRLCEVVLFGGQKQDSSSLSNDLWIFRYVENGNGGSSSDSGNTVVGNSDYGIDIAIVVLCVLNFLLLSAFLAFLIIRRRTAEPKPGDQPSHDFSVRHV